MQSIVVGLYGLLNLVGGVMGYVKAESLPSLIMGTLFGVSLMGSAFAMHQKRKGGLYGALGLTLALSAFFLWRFWTTGSLFPAATMAMISLLVLIVLLKNWQNEN